MPKIMEIIEKETRGTSYNTFKYSFDSIGLPSIVYDDDSDKIMKWQDSAETVKHIKPVDLKAISRYHSWRKITNQLFFRWFSTYIQS